MIFIDAFNLINECVNNNILKQENDMILVYRKATETCKEGLYFTAKVDLAFEVMTDEYGQKKLIEELKKKGVLFKPTDDTSIRQAIYLND